MVLAVRGCHVPDHSPSCRLIKEMATSPLLNDATTEPLVRGDPQSSTTFTMIATGQPVGTLEPDPSCENTGESLEGKQPFEPVARRSDGSSTVAFAAVPGGATTDRRLTVRMDPSSKRSVSAARRTPGVRVVRSGCTKICVGVSGRTVAFAGRYVIHLPALT